MARGLRGHFLYRPVGLLKVSLPQNCDSKEPGREKKSLGWGLGQVAQWVGCLELECGSVGRLGQRANEEVGRGYDRL